MMGVFKAGIRPSLEILALQGSSMKMKRLHLGWALHHGQLQNCWHKGTSNMDLKLTCGVQVKAKWLEAGLGLQCLVLRSSMPNVTAQCLTCMLSSVRADCKSFHEAYALQGTGIGIASGIGAVLMKMTTGELPRGDAPKSEKSTSSHLWISQKSIDRQLDRLFSRTDAEGMLIKRVLQCCLAVNPSKRATVKELLSQKWLRDSNQTPSTVSEAVSNDLAVQQVMLQMLGYCTD